MRIGLISGHGAGDSGACGCGYAEADLTIELVKKIDAVLQAKGVETNVYPYERNAFEDGKNGGMVVNFSDCKYVLEVHFNACVNDQNGDGHVTGTEIYVTPREVGVTVEEKILDHVCGLGFTRRGVKKNDFLVINLVKSQGVSSALIETCFVDDADDMDLYQNNKDAVANAIVDGILEGFGIGGSSEPEQVTPEPTPVEEPVSSGKSIDQLADEVYNGQYGNGSERKERLTAEYGADVAAQVQDRVNEKYFGIGSTSSDTEPTPEPSIDYEALADRIMRGDFGNGTGTRIERMAAEGYTEDDYNKAQAIVNSRY